MYNRSQTCGVFSGKEHMDASILDILTPAVAPVTYYQEQDAQVSSGERHFGNSLRRAAPRLV